MEIYELIKDLSEDQLLQILEFIKELEGSEENGEV